MGPRQRTGRTRRAAMQWRSRRTAAACAPAARSHSRAPTATLSVAGPSTAPPRDQRGVSIGQQTRPCRSRRRRGVRGPVAGRAWRSRARNSAMRCLPAARAARPRRQEARQERCAANRKNARSLAAPAAASVRSFEAALIWRSALISRPPPLFAQKRHRYHREQINRADQLAGPDCARRRIDSVVSKVRVPILIASSDPDLMRA